jgi:hypothetical protein
MKPEDKSVPSTQTTDEAADGAPAGTAAASTSANSSRAAPAPKPAKVGHDVHAAMRYMVLPQCLTSSAAGLHACCMNGHMC